MEKTSAPMPEIITANDAQYAIDIVKTICTEVGPGLPGSSQERKRAEILKKELESHLGAENILVEEFSISPRAFLSAYPISALFMLIAVLLNISISRLTGVLPWFTAIAALVFSIISPLPFIFQFILNKELVDPFLKKKQSLNVVGVLRNPGTKNVKRLLILSGHHDSAPENTWIGVFGNMKRLLLRSGHYDRAKEDALLRFLGYAFFILTATWFIGFATLIAVSIIQLTGVVYGNEGIFHTGMLGWILLVYPIAPSIIFPMFFIKGWKNGGNVPGAADNLSACALVVAMCRFLVKNPSYLPDDTEIRFISFGSEEAGLRGSRNYVARHLDELKRLDARLLNFETVAHPEIVILTSEGNGTVKNSPDMVKSVIDAAVRAGVPYKVMSAFLGAGSDASPFSQAGLKATTLLPFQMPQQMVEFYHQKWDRPEVLTIEPLLNVLKLTLEWVRSGGE